MSPGAALGALDLGQMIELLAVCSPGGVVTFDNGRCPSGLRSYRGYYEDLAIGAADVPGQTAGELLACCLAALGEEFAGYKGGVFRATARTGLWAADWGIASGIGIVGLSMFGPTGTVVRLTTGVIDVG